MGSDGMERWCPHVLVSTTTWEQDPATESDLSSFDEDEKPQQVLGRRGKRALTGEPKHHKDSLRTARTCPSLAMGTKNHPSYHSAERKGLRGWGPAA